MDIYFDGSKKPKKQMDDFLERFKDDYDIVFLDCPPSFSLVSENIFKSTDIMLVPLIPSTLSLRTYEQIVEYVSDHKKLSLKLMPFFSMVDRRKKLHLDTIIEGQLLEGVLKTSIPYLSIIEYMGVSRAPVGKFAPRSSAAETFQNMWAEIVSKAHI